MAIEIVDLPMKMVVFHSYVSLPEDTLDGCEILHQLVDGQAIPFKTHHLNSVESS